MDKNNNPYRKILEKRLGLFVHYGIYSALGGFWHGEAAPGLGEWIQLRARIPNAEYEKFARESFRPKEDFAKEIVGAAKKAGAKYIVLTSKHHDGFCLFKTAVDGYNTYDFYGRDLCRELVDESRKEGIGVGFYYSHTLDWHEKNGAGNLIVYNPPGVPAQNRNDWDFPDPNIDFSQYFYDKCIPQVKELLTGYGDLDLIWFDFPHDITPEQSKELRGIVKAIQPNCQINSRIAHGMEDYISLGDNDLCSMPHGINTECLVTLNHTWGYRSDDKDWNTPEAMISILTRNIAAGSALLLNIGPMGDGSLTPETHEILEELGKFTKENAEAIYGGTEPNPFPSLFDFGYTAKKKNKLFFYLNGSTEKISVSGLSKSPIRIYLTASGKETEFDFDSGVLSFTRLSCDGKAPVYSAEFDGEFEVSSTPTETDGVVYMHIVGAKKKRRSTPDTAPALLVYNPGRAIPENDIQIFNTDKICGWTDPDEYLIFEGEVKGGKYEALLIHSLTLQNWGAPIEEVDMTVTVGDLTHKVGKESERRSVTKVGSANTYSIRKAGVFDLPGGKVKLILENRADKNIPVTELRLKRIDK